MAYAEIPTFLARLRWHESIAASALEFVILTAARSGEVRGARWAEIDLGAKVWTVPAARMKANREHRVPLSKPAIAIIEMMAKIRTCDFVFGGKKAARPLSRGSMQVLLVKMEINATPHGFRSAFRDWAGNETHFPREIAEAALAHTIGDKAEQAYRRGDALEKRRNLMEAWAIYCDPEACDNVLILPSCG